MSDRHYSLRLRSAPVSTCGVRITLRVCCTKAIRFMVLLDDVLLDDVSTQRVYRWSCDWGGWRSGGGSTSSSCRARGDAERLTCRRIQGPTQFTVAPCGWSRAPWLRAGSECRPKTSTGTVHIYYSNIINIPTTCSSA